MADVQRDRERDTVLLLTVEREKNSLPHCIGMEVEEGSAKKMKPDFDLRKLISHSEEDPQPPPEPNSCSCDDNGYKEDFSHLSDRMLDEEIRKSNGHLKFFGPKMRDKGEKLRVRIKALEEEKERRKNLPTKPEFGCWLKFTKSIEPVFSGFRNVYEKEDKSSPAFSEATLGACASKRTEENAVCRTINQFDKKPTFIYPEHQKTGSIPEWSLSERQKGQSSSRKRNRITSCKFYGNGNRLGSSNHVQKDRSFSNGSLYDAANDKRRLVAEKKITSQATPTYDSRSKKEQTIVLLDEEEPLLVEATTHEEPQLPELGKDTTICYPSRDVPDPIEISFGDIDNLGPGAYLSSTIINFYIRYLQQQAAPNNREICDCQFFNTYFYRKLTEAISDKESSEVGFLKFRRWWRGVDIFQKAYVLIPIHEQVHWSLVIICIPDKEDESGPIILHLDSLGLHSSSLVFKNIRRFLNEEWNYLNKKVAPSDLPISGKVWNDLPNRIGAKKISVPQQENDSDCGLFVLYFIERFIEEAPERLKTKDLSMFSQKWFKPEEASGLRPKIRNLLIEQFQTATTE